MDLTPAQEYVGFLWDNGYRDIKLLPGNRWAATFQFLFTNAIITGQRGDMAGYEDRWCYHTHRGAKAALERWEGQGEPSGWHRHPDSGRRRTDGDLASEGVRF